MALSTMRLVVEMPSSVVRISSSLLISCACQGGSHRDDPLESELVLSDELLSHEAFPLPRIAWQNGDARSFLAAPQ